MDRQDLYYKVLSVVPLLLSLAVHEFAHARTALAFGDDTAKRMGRCSLNPLVHLDLMGTLCLLFSGFLGWAKPVPVNRCNLHPPRLGDIMVSLAGPLSNLCLAFVAGLVLKETLLAYGVAIRDGTPMGTVQYVLLITTLANIGLFTFNLIPLFPLDGHHVVRELLPPRDQNSFMQWQTRYGSIALMVLIFGPQFLPVFNPVSWLYGHATDIVLTIIMRL